MPKHVRCSALKLGLETALIVGYTPGMKTAISIPDDVFEQADALARELKQSRSQLYARAVREYVARHSADNVTAALNAVCDQITDEDSAFIAESARQAGERIEW